MGSDPVLAATCAALGAIGAGLYAVACSGGADSLALADAAIRVAGAHHVVVVTIDHGLQPGSAEVAARVGAWARGQGAAALVERVAVRAGASVEAAAREARYAAFERIADATGVAAVLLGHTARDQAETILYRIVRGTGPAGLAAMATQRDRYVRPLLALDRAEIDAYVARRGLPVWSDPMNADRRFARVRLREEILPALRAENPQIDAALVRLASSAAEWLEVIDQLAAPLVTLPIDCARLARQPAAVRKRVLAWVLGEDLGAVHLEALDDLVTSPTRGTRSVDVPGGRVVRTYDALDRARDLGATSPPDPAGPDANPRPHADPGRPPALPSGLSLRPYQPGDRMRPARLKGRSRKLSDLFTDAKIPRDRRLVASVIVDVATGDILWAEHVGLAAQAPASLAALLAESPGGFH